MNAAMIALNDYRLIWGVTTRRARGRRFLYSTMFLLLLGATIILFGLAFTRNGIGVTVVARVLLGAAAAWLALVWGVLFLPASVAMNSAAHACLLPRQRRRLMQMAAAGWLLVTGAVSVAGDWHLGLPVGGLLLLFMLACGGKLVVIIPLVLASQLPALAPDAWQAVLDAPVSQVGQLLALLALTGRSLYWLYPAGGDAHLEQAVGRAAFLERFGHGHATSTSGRGKGGLPWLAGRVYRAALRRDCRSRNPARLLMHALGPIAHWSAWIAGSATILALGGIARLMFFVTHAEGIRALLEGVAGLGLMSQVLAVVFSTAQYSQLLRRHAGEQALLRLTPLAGDAGLLNRRLANQLLGRALLNWALLTATIVVTSFVIDAGPSVALRQFALCCLAGQVALYGLLGDYAGKGGWTLALAVRAALLAALQGALALAFSWLTASSPWPWLIGLALSCGAVGAARGWCRMLAAPAAFPVGRMT